MKIELVSIIIATYNSEKTLKLCLESVKKQTYPKNKIETLVIDGGSTDKTLNIAKKYKCKIVNNPKKEPIAAKHIGLLNAKGKYAMYLDSDEVIENSECISMRISIFLQYPKVKSVVGSGYKSPSHYPFINSYINEFGDPFSFFIYRLSKDSRFYIHAMKKKYKIVKDMRQYTIFDLTEAKILPIIELIAMGSMVDIAYLKATFPDIKKNPSLVPHFFYLLNTNKKYIALTKNDALYHYSSEGIRKYLGKISWRVKNNIHHTSTLGLSAFVGREEFQPKFVKLRKYLFIPYSLFIIPSFVDAIWLSISRRDINYLIHVYLCLYTALIIIQQYILKILGKKPILRSYGDQDIVDLK